MENARFQSWNLQRRQEREAAAAELCLLEGEHSHAARRALSHRGGRVLTLSGRFLRRMRSKVSRAALQGQRERGSAC